MYLPTMRRDEKRVLASTFPPPASPQSAPTAAASPGPRQTRGSIATPPALSQTAPNTPAFPAAIPFLSAPPCLSVSASHPACRSESPSDPSAHERLQQRSSSPAACHLSSSSSKPALHTFRSPPPSRKEPLRPSTKASSRVSAPPPDIAPADQSTHASETIA